MVSATRICAAAIVLAFFMPWISIDIVSISGYQLARFGMEMASKTSTSLSDGVIWLWLVPGLAVVALIFAGKGVLGRICAIVAGAYPWYWLIRWHSDVSGRAGSSVAEQTASTFFKYLGIGGYLTLGAAIALILVGVFAKKPAKE